MSADNETAQVGSVGGEVKREWGAGVGRGTGFGTGSECVCVCVVEFVAAPMSWRFVLRTQERFCYKVSAP